MSHSSTSINDNGVKDFTEHLRMKYPEMDFVADRTNSDIFDVKIRKHDGKEVFTEKVPADQLQNKFQGALHDLTKKIDQEMSKCIEPEANKALGSDIKNK